MLVQMTRYTRNTNRYISNAGGWDGIFFLNKALAAIFKPTDFAGTIACPARFRSERGTEEAPLFILEL